MDWNQIVLLQRQKVENLFDRMQNYSTGARLSELQAAYEQERECLAAMEAQHKVKGV